VLINDKNKKKKEKRLNVERDKEPLKKIEYRHFTRDWI